jgi:pilus assembly protein CpaF
MAEKPNQAEVFVFTSFQGGAGKSSTAIHFARQYQKYTGLYGFFLEMNLFTPSAVTETLGLKDRLKTSFLDFYSGNWQGFSSNDIFSLFTEIDKVFIVPFTGIRSAEVLQPRFSFQEAEIITPLEKLLQAVTQRKMFVVIDLPLSLNPVSRFILDCADAIFYTYIAQSQGTAFASLFLREADNNPHWKKKVLFLRNMIDGESGSQDTGMFEPEFRIPIDNQLLATGKIGDEAFEKALRQLAEKAYELPNHEKPKRKSEIHDVQQLDPLREYKNKLRADVVANLERGFGLSDQELRKKVEENIDQAFGRTPPPFIQGLDARHDVKKYVMDEILGLGPLEELMRDPEVDEIMVNGPGKIFIERKGQLSLTGKTFNSPEHVRTVIDRILMPVGRTVNERTPYVDARLQDGSRAHAIIPPLSLTGPMLTIRKFARDPYSIDDLIFRFKTITPQVAEFLQLCVKMKKNIVVSGGASSGKTTLLNVLSSFISPQERVICIEDSAELKLHQENLGRLEARQQGTEAKNQVTIRDLVKNALRMRPDRIVVGECRADEALDMLQAMNTGHDGSLTTLHANTPRDALARLETMVLMAGVDLPLRAIREQIASSVNILIQTSRLSDGSRKVVEISEVTGFEDSSIVIQPIFRFEKKWITEEGHVFGEMVSTGTIPMFLKNIPGNIEETTKRLFEST